MNLIQLKRVFLMVCLFQNIYCSAQTNSPINTKSVTLQQLNKINDEIWKRFIDKWGIMLEYTDLDGSLVYPTSEELLLGKPNALGWNTPLENGAMYGGMYIDGAIKRWQHTQTEEDANKVKKIASGLMYLSTVSPVPGAVVRGVGLDGKSYYLMGSDDQAGGWYYGIWRYLQTNLPDSLERKTITDKVISVSKAIVAMNWSLPSDPPFHKRGTFITFDYQAPRLLFVCKVCYELTKDEYWRNLYLKSLSERGGPQRLSRLQVTANGFASNAVVGSWWVRAVTIGCLHSLWELESDSTLKDAYRQGLELTANSAYNFVGMGYKLKQNDTSTFNVDWRYLNDLWRPQATENESQAVAIAQIHLINQPRRIREDHAVRQASFAAWIVSLAPNENTLKRRLPDLKLLLDQFKYSGLYHVWFFPLEAVGWRIMDFN